MTEDIIKLLKCLEQKDRFQYFMKLTNWEQFYLLENMLNIIRKEVNVDD